MTPELSPKKNQSNLPITPQSPQIDDKKEKKNDDVVSVAKNAIPQSAKPQEKEMPKTTTESFSIFGWVGEKLLGTDDKNDKSIELHRDELAKWLPGKDGQDLIQQIREMTEMLGNKAESSFQGTGYIDQFVRNHMPLMKNILEVNILHSYINLIKHLKEVNPNYQLNRDNLNIAIIDTVAKEANAGQTSQVAQEDLTIKKILAIIFPHGQKDIIIPTSKTGFFDLSGLIYGILSEHLPNIFLGFQKKMQATNSIHEQNLAEIQASSEGKKLIELGKMLSKRIDRLIVSSNKNEGEGQGELGKLLSGVSNYSEIIAMHILAHTMRDMSMTGDKRNVLTCLMETLLSDVRKFFKGNAALIENEIGLYRAEMKIIEVKYPIDCPGKQRAMADARKNIDEVFKPLTDTIKARLGIDEKNLNNILPSFQELLPSQSRLFKIGVWFLEKQRNLAGLVSDQLGGFISDLFFELSRDVIYPENREPTCKEKFTDYPETVKTIDATINELIPNLNLLLLNHGNDLISNAGKFQTDAKLFETPIKEFLNSNIMIHVNTVTHDLVKRTLVSLFANLANSYHDQKEIGKVGMLSSAIPHLFKICSEQIQNYDEVIRNLDVWKKGYDQFQKMAAGPEKEKKLLELELLKEGLCKAFLPAAKEILNKGGWQNNDSENILMPAMFKKPFKNLLETNLLPSVLFTIYSDAFALSSLTEEEQEKLKLKHPERVSSVVEGLVNKSLPGIKEFLGENSHLLLNQNMINSKLNIEEETVIGGQLQQIINTKESRKIWEGIETWLTNVLTLALNRLSLAYQGVDQGDALSNAIMQLRVLVDAQKIDPELVTKIQFYQQQTQKIKELDKQIAKLKAKALLEETIGKMNPELLSQIKDLTLIRREMFLNMHFDEYELQDFEKKNQDLDNQMKLVRDLKKLKTLKQQVEKKGLSVLESGELHEYLSDYQRNVKEKQTQLTEELAKLEQDLLQAEGPEKIQIQSKIKDLQGNLFIENKKLEKNPLLTYKISDINVQALPEILEALEKEKTLELEKTPPLQKVYQSILDQFKPFSKQLLNAIGFKVPEDLPVPYLQSIVFKTLEESVLPKVFLELYDFAWVPMSSVKIGEDLQKKEMLSSVSNFGSEKLREMITMKNSSLSKLIADALGIEGLDALWLKGWLGNLAQDDERNLEFWSLIPQFLQNRLEFVAAHMDAHSPNTNIVQQLVTLIFQPLATYFKEHANEIAEANWEYDMLPDDDKIAGKKRIAKKYFSEVVNDIFEKAGLNQAKASGIAFLEGTIISSLKTTLEGYCFDFAYRKANFEEKVSRDALEEVITDAKMLTFITSMAHAAGGMVRDTAKKQLGLMPNDDEKIISGGSNDDNWAAAFPGQWVLRESNSIPGQFSLIQKQKGISKKESPRISLTGTTPEEMHRAIAEYKNNQIALEIAKKITSMLRGSAPSESLTNWLAGSIKETLYSMELQQLLSDTPDLIGAVVLKKMIQLSKAKDLPIKPKEGESPLKYMPANLSLIVLNSIEVNRQRLKRITNSILHNKPKISNEELAKELKPEFAKIVKKLFKNLQMDLKNDIPVPFAEEIWKIAGEDAVVDMFAKVYVGMTTNMRQKQDHMISLDTRFDKTEAGHKHTRLVEAVKDYAEFAMKYLQNMMAFNTPGIEGGLEAVDRMFRAQGDIESANYLEANWEGAKEWLVNNNLKTIAKNGAPGVKATAKSSLQTIMLKIFDNFTGNIEKIEDKNPDITFNFALNLISLLTEHLQLANEITQKQHKKYLHEADPVLMEKEFAESQQKLHPDKPMLHPDMPGYQWRKAMMQVGMQVEVLENEVQKLQQTGQKLEEAQRELQAAKASLESLRQEAKKKLNEGTYKKMAGYLLHMAGYNQPEDLTEVPSGAQQVLWDALNNSLGPELIGTIFGKAFEPAMLNTYLLKLLQIVNEKLAAVPSVPQEPAQQITNAEDMGAVKARQDRCKNLLKALTALVPDTALTTLTKLDLVNNLAAAQIESVLKESLKEWSMLNIIEESLVIGSKNLPQGKLPETMEEAKAAEELPKKEDAKTPQQIREEAVKVRQSIWKMLKNKWKGMQATIDNWIARHDVMGIFSGIKKGLDKVCHIIVFDLIGTAVLWILRYPLDKIWYLYQKRRLEEIAENLRKNLVSPPIHQNLGLRALDEFMKSFPSNNNSR